MMPWESNALIFGAVLFGVACLLLVLCGTTNWRRFFGVVAQVCILAGLIRAAWPVEPKTEVGRFADAVGRSVQERIASKYLEQATHGGIVDAR